VNGYPLPLGLAQLLEEVPEAAPQGLGVQLWQGEGQGRVPPLRGDGARAKRVVRGRVCGRLKNTFKLMLSRILNDDEYKK